MNKIIFLLFLLPQVLGCNNKTNGTESAAENIEDGTEASQGAIKTAETTRSPLLLSKDHGKTWRDVSQGLPPEIQVSFMEIMGSEMVIATDNLGLFVSSNNRSQWKRVGTFLPSQKINALHISGDAIFVGVYRKGIYRSDDGGTTWVSINENLPNLDVQAIGRFDEELFVGADSGLFKRSKDGKAWNPAGITAQVLSIYEYEGILVVGTSLGTAISQDRGNSWNWIRKQGAVHYTHHIGRRVIELVLNGDVIYTDNWGEKWGEMSYKPREGSYVYEIVRVDNDLLLSNNYGIHRSVDNGLSWELVFETESMAFFDLSVIGSDVYGGTRAWDEYRKRGK